ncbi:MAG: hypothetical protein IJT25_01080 [Clostridia bacterium]|nr:hypothetical protein [Clostridia bacterium]
MKYGLLKDEFNNFSVMDKKTGAIKSMHSAGEDKKYFGIVAMCGHCEPNYYIPVLFPILTSSMDLAVEKVKHLPRVKYNDEGNSANKDAILAAFEINVIEATLIRCINNRDPYLQATNKDEFFPDREIIKRNYLELLERRRSIMLERVKTAEDYNDKYALEKYFAPIKQGTSFVYKRKFTKDELLKDFFTQALKNTPLDKNSPQEYTDYLRLYGEPNDLNAAFNGNEIIVQKDGKTYKLLLEKKFINGINTAYKQRKDNEVIEITSTTNKPSQIDKFKAKLQKSQALKQNNDEEMTK